MKSRLPLIILLSLGGLLALLGTHTWTAKAVPPADKLLNSVAVEDKLVGDLQNGNNAEIRQALHRQGVLVHTRKWKVDSLGPVFKQHIDRLRNRWKKSIQQDLKRLHSTEEKVHRESTSPFSKDHQIAKEYAAAYYDLERCLALTEAITEGHAFYSTASIIPTLEGWRFVVALNFPVPFDTETGEVVTKLPNVNLSGEVREYSTRVKSGRYRERNLNVVIPIKMANNRAFEDAITFQNETERQVHSERERAFNAKPFYERKRLYRLAKSARGDLRRIRPTLGGRNLTPALTEQIRTLTKIVHACNFQNFDKDKMLALPPKQR